MEIVEKWKQMEEQSNRSITFDCSGALDFTSQILFELSPIPKEGFVEIFPMDFLKEMYKMKHISQIVMTYFIQILGRYPHISDLNKDLPEIKRFTKMYYKCYRLYRHSHEPWHEYHYTNMTLQEAVKYVIKEEYDITLPRINKSTNRELIINDILK